jgi:hypothetical protein
MGMKYSDIEDTAGQAPLVSGGMKYADIQDEPVAPSEPQMVEMPSVGPLGEPMGTREMVEVKEPKPFEDLPTVAEMPLTNVPGFGKTAQTQLGMMFSSTPEGARKIIEQNVPGSRYGSDKYGNPLIIVPDDKGVEQAYHLDKPGINALDFSRFVGKSVAALPASMTAAYLAPAATVGLPIAAAMQGAAGGISSILEDVASNVLGSEETPDLGKAALSTAIGAAGPVVGEAGKSLAAMWTPDVFNSMSRGAQNFLRRLSDKFKAGDIPTPKDGRDVLLDTPQFRALAKSIIDESPDSPAAKTITNLVRARDEATPTRVRDGVDSSIGRATVSEREADEAYKQYMASLSPQETALLNSAGPIDPSGIVQKIDSMLPTAQGKTASALQKIRSFFVENEGTPGTKASVREIKDPNTGRVIRREYLPAQPGTPPTYKTNAQALESARLEIDSLLDKGDPTLGITPGELRGRKGAISSIRQDLSGLLKKEIKGYKDIMGDYGDTYALIEANKIGQNLFAGGEMALRPDQVALFMKDPAQAPALRASVRSLINNKLNGPVEDVAVLKRMLGGEEDYSRKSLENIFGKNEINRLARVVDRELEFRQTSRDLLPAQKAAQGAEMQQSFASDVGDITIPQTFSGAGSLAMKPLSAARRMAKGTNTPEFREDLSKFMTAPATELPAYARGMQKSLSMDEAIKRAQTFTPFAERLPSAATGRPEDREGRATGGAVNLMALSKAAKKHVTRSTEDLLNESDDTVARALEVANKHI